MIDKSYCLFQVGFFYFWLRCSPHVQFIWQRNIFEFSNKNKQSFLILLIGNCFSLFCNLKNVVYFFLYFVYYKSVVLILAIYICLILNHLCPHGLKLTGWHYRMFSTWIMGKKFVDIGLFLILYIPECIYVCSFSIPHNILWDCCKS